MIPLLGITWVFGLLLPFHKAFAYIFTIFNSTQVSFKEKPRIFNNSYVHFNTKTTATFSYWSGDISDLKNNLFKLREFLTSFLRSGTCLAFVLRFIYWIKQNEILMQNQILIQFSVLGFPDFRLSLCTRQPGKMDINLKMHLKQISKFLDINKDLSARWFIFRRVFIYRLESDWKERWTPFFHLQTMNALQRKVRKLIQEMSAVLGQLNCSRFMNSSIIYPSL